MVRDPEVTVVIATFRRPHLLPALVAGLVAQAEEPGISHDRFDVVIVDDASGDSTQAVLEQLAASAPFRMRSIRQPVNAGPATARNVGWRSTPAPIVAFSDDDCVAQRGWLARLLAGIEDGADIVQGRTEPDPDHLAEHGPFGRTLRVPREEGFYETCNIAYRRDWLERLEGFDESYRRPYGEDTDLAWRAREAGARTAFAEDAVVHHAVFASDWWAAARDVARSEGLHRAMRKHPQLRRHLGKRVFHRPSHLAALTVLAAVVALALNPTSVAWCVIAAVAGARYAWVVRQSRRAPRSRVRWAVVVPAALLLDLYETTVFLRASLRHRTVLL